MSIKTFLMAILLVAGLKGQAQDRPAYFVQFKISKITSKSQALAVDKKIGGKKGVLSTHTDHLTSTYFCTLDPEAEYTFDVFEGWFQKLGYEISCFNKGIHGNGGMKSPHELKNCEENNSK
jgi:hypothetical protein